MSWPRLAPALALPTLLAWLVLLAGCAALAPATTVTSMRLVGMHALAPGLHVDAGLVGGISGIDYDAASGEWLLASDDRGQHGPARFYRARIGVAAGAPQGVDVRRSVVLRQADGGAYPAWGQSGVPADIEALRIDPQGGAIWYASEGDRKAGVPSFVRRAGAEGGLLGELPYPASLQIVPDREYGGRSNMGMEGMSFTHDGRRLWLAMEAPAIQDGPVPAPGQGALSRISLVERDGKVAAQYAYPLDAAPTPAFEGGFVDNGVSEILALGPLRLLVLERAGRQVAGKRFDFAVRLYEVDLARAEPLDPQRPLARLGRRPAPAHKRLLFDSASLPAGWADNYEAMAWGPAPAGGGRTLMIASDNNFSGGPTRFLVFDVATAHD